MVGIRAHINIHRPTIPTFSAATQHSPVNMDALSPSRAGQFGTSLTPRTLPRTILYALRRARIGANLHARAFGAYQPSLRCARTLFGRGVRHLTQHAARHVAAALHALYLQTRARTHLRRWLQHASKLGRTHSIFYACWLFTRHAPYFKLVAYAKRLLAAPGAGGCRAVYLHHTLPSPATCNT